MTTETPLVNRVANSGLITINLEDYFPSEPLCLFDLKEYLFHGLILREKDFREAMQAHDWTQYAGKNIALYCSADAIIPHWAYMLVVVYAQPFANYIVQGNEDVFYTVIFREALQKLHVADYTDQRIVIKGCSHKPVPVSAYVELTGLLRPVAKSIMYGEACSTVPLYKKKA
jgi:hypothetical protein